MSTAPANERRIDPDRYHERVGDTFSAAASAAAICLYLETTDRRNLLRTTVCELTRRSSPKRI
jgi:hypothetical protein